MNTKWLHGIRKELLRICSGTGRVPLPPARSGATPKDGNKVVQALLHFIVSIYPPSAVSSSDQAHLLTTHARLARLTHRGDLRAHFGLGSGVFGPRQQRTGRGPRAADAGPHYARPGGGCMPDRSPHHACKCDQRLKKCV